MPVRRRIKSDKGAWRVGNMELMLFQAAKSGNLSSLQMVLGISNAEKSINFQDENGQTALMIAAKNGCLDCVKLLLSRGADLKLKTHRNGQEVTAIHLAKKAGNTVVTQYLQKCMTDIKKIGTPRAHLEAFVDKIASSPHCSAEELNRFSSTLRLLLSYCEYDLNSFNPKPGQSHTPLLIRATRAGNVKVVLKLINDFEATPLINDTETGHNILHLACLKKSQLRFYFAKRYPHLLRNPDSKGSVPLHLACEHNDIDFCKWLFGKVLAEESEMDNFILPIENGLKRTNSLPEIPTGRKPYRRLSLHKKTTKQQEAALSKTFNILSPVASMPLFKPTHRRAKSGGQLDPLDDNSDSRENSPMTFREAGLTHSYESTRSSTISFGSGRSRNNSQSSNNQSSSMEASSDSHGTRDMCEPRESRGFSPEAIDRECATPVPTSPLQTNGFSDDSDLLEIASICSQHPLTVVEICEIKPFRVDMLGKTILHILARHGHAELLGLVLKVADFLKRSIDFSLLVSRDGRDARIPVEEAIISKSPACVRLLIHFTILAGFYEDLLNDTLLVKNAVFSSDIDVVKVLLEFGFTAGIGPAIALACFNEYHNILRLLLFFHTQITNTTEFVSVSSRSQRVTLAKGGINWEGLQLDQIHPDWLNDSFHAVSFVLKHFQLNPVFGSTEGNHELYTKLGQDCIKYFDVALPSQSNLTLSISHLSSITEINASANNLTQVPPELFQISFLRVLRLSHNQLSSLPVSQTPFETNYTSPIQKLELDWNKLESLPEQLFTGLADTLEDLSVECNSLRKLPPGLWICPKLKVLKLSRNKLSTLHTLSDCSYFIDPELSKCVTGCFTVDGVELKCSVEDEQDLRKTKDLQKVERYLRQVTDYYSTVLKVVKSDIPVSKSDYYQKVISLHLGRAIFYGHSNEDSSSTNLDNISCKCTGLLLPAEDEEEEGDISKLETLDLSCNQFKEIPWDLACLAPNLVKLDLSQNELTHIDLVHGLPVELKGVNLDDNKLVDVMKAKATSLPCGDTRRLLTIPDENFGCNYCRHCKHSVLNSLTNLSLNSNQLTTFPVIDVVSVNTEDPELEVAYDMGTVTYLPFYPNLSILSLERNALTEVPENLHHLTHLSSLSLSYNDIRELSPQLGLINAQQLLLLKLEGLFFKNIPSNLLNRPTPKHLLSYLKALLQKSKPYRRIKLMVVGEAEKGKTSLLLNLRKKGRISRFKDVAMSINNKPLATVGVELGDWEYSPNMKSQPPVTFMTWDFGGQAEYYATHQCFLTKRSLYILVWNVVDGERGLLSLRPWLENIEARAPESPVFVIATHLDMLAHDVRAEKMARIRRRFKKLFIECDDSAFRYPRIYPQCFFVNCHDSRSVDEIRLLIYNFVTEYKPPAPRHLIDEMDPLLEQPIPASYILLQDIVRSLADYCSEHARYPIYTKQEFITAVKGHEAGYYEKLYELEQATNFLHDNGILLHFEDSSLLSDLYFVDPQWLCSMLAKVVTVQERNPYQRNGIMPLENLKKIFPDYIEELISLMHRFEVVLQLDTRRMLIPSLLPLNEEDSIPVLLRSVCDVILDRRLNSSKSDDTQDLQQVPHAPLCQAPHPLLSRYYLLPFVPNGFFTRVIARIMGTDIMDNLHSSLHSNQFEDGHVLNAAHWRCWRDGISIVWSHMEVFRIAPVTYPLEGTPSTVLVSSGGEQAVQSTRGIEIRVGIFPDESIDHCSMIPSIDPSTKFSGKGRCLSTWLLHRAITIVDSVFEDWYEAFSKKKGFELSSISTGTPCNKCYRAVQAAEVRAISTPLQRRLSTFSMSFDVIGRWSTDTKPLCMFSSTYCMLALEKGLHLKCPHHGEVKVADITPDLVFSDFPPAKVFHDSASVVIKKQLGDGGFGTVFKATLNTGSEVLNIAVKQFRSELAFLEEDEQRLAELKSWDIYQKASQEARVMLPLYHPNILGLIGLTFRPVRLLVELAPLGDLKACVKQFKKAKVRLSRTTLKQTLIQTAEALNYLHFKRFIYRDLKPDNVLVWKFPTPETQWTPASCVAIKIADYGISKEVTPQGIRGVEGTRPYLAPEVILHGGKEAYSNSLDVYAFGMFMYYLTSFMTPFEMDSRPITALLEEGRRPELPQKLRPHSLYMFELMCWCWSDLPQHRPDFQQILDILKQDSFTDLLTATSVTKDIHEITSASSYTLQTRRASSGSFHRNSVGMMASGNIGVDLSLYNTGALSLMTGSQGEDLTTQVWYGTDQGSCGMVQFHKNILTKEEIEIPSSRKKYISDVTVVDGNVWICTAGAGLWVYNTAPAAVRQPRATWGEGDKQQIYTLLSINETSSVLIMTRKGLYVFDSILGTPPHQSMPPIEISPRKFIEKTSDMDLNEGVVIESGANLSSTEIWLCSQLIMGFKILDKDTFGTVEEIKPSGSNNGGHKIRHLTSVELEGRKMLLVADKHLIQIWDVVDRAKVEEEIDCSELCKPVYSKNYNLRMCRVTCLLFRGDFLYVGTGGGAILILDTSTMLPHKILYAYTKPVRCLLLVQSDSQSPRVFQRLFSIKAPHPAKRNLSRTSTGSMSTSSLQSNIAENSERAVLISLALSYRGVTGEADNHHSMFMLPSDGSKNNTKLAKMPSHYAHLLLWSTETSSNSLASQDCDCTNQNGMFDLNELPEINESSSIEVDESLFERGD